MRLLALLLASAVLCAQPVARLGPLKAHLSGVEPAASKPPSISNRLPAAPVVQLGKLRREEMDRVAPNPRVTLRGYERLIDAHVPDRGQWQALADGRRVWRLSLQAEGAFGVRIRFTGFDIGSGGVWVYGGGSQVFGPYKGRGPGGSGEFWSNTVSGDSITVEYQPGEVSQNSGDAGTPFGINRVSQMVAPEQAMAAGTCELDVSCYPAWAAAASGVGMYLFQSGGASYICSGALINNTAQDGTPYFLTANHCVADADSAASVEVFWNYQTSSCNGLAPDLANSPRTLGATYLASAPIPSGDFSLIVLSGLPAIPLNFFGWDASPTAVPMGTNLTGIHHPEADYTRIAFGVRASDGPVLVGSDLAPANLYYQVQETSGRIEPGSSGSPLFTSDQLLVGTLTYGPTTPACSTSPFLAGYSRFAAAYPSLATYLSAASSNVPAPPPTVTLSPAAVTVPYTVGAPAPAASSVQVTTTSTSAMTLTLGASQPWIGLAASSLPVAAGQPANFTFTVDPTLLTTPGTSTGTITVAGGNVTQTIAVTVNVAASTAAAAGGPMSLIPLFEDGPGVSTAFVLLNPYSTATNASIAFATAAGDPLEVPLAGQAAAAWQNVTIPAFGSVTLATPGTSSQTRSGVAVIQSSDASKKVQPYALINQDTIAAAPSHNLPLALPFDATSGGGTTLYLYNPAATGLLNLTLTVYDTTGATIGSGSVSVPAGQESAIPMTPTSTVFGGKAGTLYVWGSGTVLAMGVRSAPDGRLSMVTPW